MGLAEMIKENLENKYKEADKLAEFLFHTGKVIKEELDQFKELQVDIKGYSLIIATKDGEPKIEIQFKKDYSIKMIMLNTKHMYEFKCIDTFKERLAEEIAEILLSLRKQ